MNTLWLDWFELRLLPGEHQGVHAYIDQNPQPADVQWLSTDPSIANVSGGGLNARTQGETTIIATTRDGQLSASLPVIVGPKTNYHHARDGAILDHYDWPRSVLPLSLFQSGFSGHGLPTVESGFFQNPADGTHPPDLPSFEVGATKYLGIIMQQAIGSGSNLILTGDDLLRSPTETEWTKNTPWSLDAFQFCLEYLRQHAGIVPQIEMLDEADFLGNTPPPIVHQVVQRLQASSLYPAWSWPVQGLASPEVARAWMGPELAKYATHYYPYPPFRRTLEDDWQILSSTIYGRRPLFPTGWPWGSLGVFAAGQADPPNFQQLPTNLLARSMANVVLGACHMRFWVWDASTPGNGHNSPQLPQLITFAKLIRDLTPWLLLPWSSAPGCGPGIVSGARSAKDWTGKKSSLVMAVNMTSQPVPARIDLTPWWSESRTFCDQYQGLGDNQVTQTRIHTNFFQETLQPGEVRAWVMGG